MSQLLPSELVISAPSQVILEALPPAWPGARRLRLVTSTEFHTKTVIFSEISRHMTYGIDMHRLYIAWTFFHQKFLSVSSVLPLVAFALDRVILLSMGLKKILFIKVVGSSAGVSGGILGAGH